MTNHISKNRFIFVFCSRSTHQRGKRLTNKRGIYFLRALISPVCPGCYSVWPHTWYLSPRSPIYWWRKNRPCGEISDINTWQMRRNLKFLHMWINFTTWQMWRNLKSPLLCVQFMVFCCILRCFVAKKLVFCDLRCFSQNRFVAIYALLCGENFS